MLEALHRAGHKYLKLLFVTALAGSSALFFIGSAVPKPPTLVVIIIGATLGVAVEWAYFTVSCDLTESITEGHKGGIALNLFYTVIGGIASWFLFTNAALHVGWAPTDDLLGLDRTTWAKIMGVLVVVIIFVLSARRKRPKEATDLQSIARSVMILLPDAPDAIRLRLLSTVAVEAAKYNESKVQPKQLSAANVVEQAQPHQSLPAAPALPPSTRQKPRWKFWGEQQPPLPSSAPPQPTGEQVQFPPDEQPPMDEASSVTAAGGVFENLPMPVVRAEQGNHRYEGGSFRPSQES